MMKKLLLYCFFCAYSYSYASVDFNIERHSLNELERVYISGNFRVYYSTNPKSKHFLKDIVDKNENFIPDYVENVAIQANMSLAIFSYLNFTSPLEQERYKKIVEFIDIHIENVKANGIAFEKPALWINKESKFGNIALLIVINNKIENFPGNYWTTVTHELFHLYQYGYSQFKGGWYLEGMANWAERSLKLGYTGKNSYMKLPQTQGELEEIYQTSYNHLWNRLAELSDSSLGVLDLPEYVLNATYTDGSKVFKDEKFKGYKFIRRVLERFSMISNRLSLDIGRAPYSWKEKDQISPLNRPYMLDAIQQTMIEFGMDKTIEEKNFLKLQ